MNRIIEVVNVKKVGIILAMNEELEAVAHHLQNATRKKVFELVFHSGHIGYCDCVLVKCGIGKVNAARTTQVLIDHFKVDTIFNIGVAGGVANDLNIGDIVVGTTLVQHDFDITSFGHEKGYISGVGRFLKTDETLLEMIKTVSQSDDFRQIHIREGVIASGDIFCTDRHMSQKIHDKFDALCVEMEGASIAQVCHLCGIPFMVLRSISDIPNGTNEIDFAQFLQTSSDIVAKMLVKILELSK